MWPVQTLTLLLCLTDDEQLYARIQPDPIPPVTIEQAAAPACEEDASCIAPFAQKDEVES
ncbi:MAG: hypothetical protein H6595_10955 [Flavobacteriales bacterium]|nr:hypothetical protein [Flavobacteriales bacterium]MCB9167981.1 hypothetical protein [Flavobacteriales bacterium]